MKRQLVENNPDTVVRILLHYYSLRFDGYTKALYHNHPRFRGIEAIAYVLSRRGIDSSLIKTDLDELKELPTPFVISYDGLFLPVAGVGNDNQLTIITESGEREEIQLILDGRWDCKALILREDGFGTEDYPKNQFMWSINQALLYLANTILIIIASYLSIRVFTFHCSFGSLYLVFSLIGVIVCVAFHIQKNDRGNILINKICHPIGGGGHSSKRDCASILDSKAAWLLGITSWVDVGSIYFLICLVSVWCLPTAPTIAGLSLFAICASTYIPYSIYYQAVIAKRWCMLCLAIQCILLCFAIFALFYFLKAGFNASHIVYGSTLIITIAIVVVPLYALLDHIISSYYRLKAENREYRWQQFSPEGRSLLFSRLPQVNINRSFRIPIIIKDGVWDLTMIINPRCSPCIRKTRDILNLLKRKRYTNLSIILLINPNDNLEIILSKSLIGEALSGDILKALIKYTNAFPSLTDIANHESAVITETLQRQLDWCSRNNIASTPSILLNGAILPNSLSINDIDYIIQ